MTIVEPILQSSASLWVQPGGENTNWEIFTPGQLGIGDITLPGGGARTIIYRTGLNGQAVALTVTRDPPGQPAFDIEAYLQLVRDFFEKARIADECYNLQVRFANGCSDLDDPTTWAKLIQFGQVQTGDQTIGAPASREFAAGTIPLTTPQQPIYDVLLVQQGLTSIASGVTEDVTGVTFISTNRGCADCPDAYNGPDQHGFFTVTEVTLAAAKVLTTSNGAATLTETTTPPFAVDLNIGFPMARSISKDNWRLLIPRTFTDVAAPAQIAWTDSPKGDEANVIPWVLATLGSNNGDVVTAARWLEFSRVYAAYGAGVIAWSQNQGKTYTDLFTGTNLINAFALHPKTGSTYAVGEASTVMIDAGSAGVFTALTGPTGALSLTSMTIGNNGNLWVGDATGGIWRSTTPLPSSTLHWVLQNTMANGVVDLVVKGGDRALGGDPQILHIVESPAAAAGTVNLTTDGGAFIMPITTLTNTGYLDSYFSPVDDNKGFIVGEGGVIHKLIPAGV